MSLTLRMSRDSLMSKVSSLKRHIDPNHATNATNEFVATLHHVAVTTECKLSLPRGLLAIM